MDLLFGTFGEFLKQLLNPSNIALLTTVGGIGYRVFKSIIKIIEKQQDDLIVKLDARLSSLEKLHEEQVADLKVEVLRLQLLTGIDSHRLSESEVLYFFDKYKQNGGNSFVEDKVEAYLVNLRQKGGESNGPTQYI